MGKARRAARAGRKSDPDAKSRQTTREGRGTGPDRGTAELRDHRRAAAGDEPPPGAGAIPASTEFPLDVLAQRGVITAEQREEGQRFASLAWALFGAPGGSCAALYERMVAGGADDGGQKPAGDDDAEAEKEAGERRAAQWREYRALERILSRLEFDALRRAAQYLEMPQAAREMISGGRPSWGALTRLADLTNALRALTARRRADGQRGRV